MLLPLSADLHVLIRPAAAFRSLDAAAPTAGRDLAWRRPLFITFVFGGAISLAATGSLTLWLVLAEARRARLDVVAITPHNHLWPAKMARWLAERTGGPAVLVGEEIASSRYHLLAVGIDRTVSWRLPAAEAIDQAHAQGGIAIAAHPVPGIREGYDEEALGKLDGAEVMHPLSFVEDSLAADLRGFWMRTGTAAIGDSDYHGLGQMGVCRTFVFARERTAAGVLDAVRHRRTVVYDGNRAYGDPALVDAAAHEGRLPAMAAAAGSRPLLTADGALGLIGLFAAVLFGGGRADRERAHSSRMKVTSRFTW
jgi:predicted metal-dependent phosphoesterase TrpH